MREILVEWHITREGTSAKNAAGIEEPVVWILIIRGTPDIVNDLEIFTSQEFFRTD